MKIRKMLCLVVCFTFTILLVSCKKNEEAPTASMQVSVEEVEKQIIKDILGTNVSGGNSEMVATKISDSVSVNVEEVTGDGKIVVAVEAPDISKELYEWMQTQDDTMTEESLDAKIKELLAAGEKKASTYTIPYVKKSEDSTEIEIQYTYESKNALSCGMVKFYGMCIEEIIKDMKEGATNANN